MYLDFTWKQYAYSITTERKEHIHEPFMELHQSDFFERSVKNHHFPVLQHSSGRSDGIQYLVVYPFLCPESNGLDDLLYGLSRPLRRIFGRCILSLEMVLIFLH